MTFALSIPDEMRQKYIERRGRDLTALKDALARNDFEYFFKVGHQLRGNAATFGYDALALLGEKLEEASNGHDRAGAEACISTLSHWIEEHRGPIA